MFKTSRNKKITSTSKADTELLKELEAKWVQEVFFLIQNKKNSFTN